MSPEYEANTSSSTGNVVVGLGCDAGGMYDE